ncbi:unnamed protein product, partial [Symbiodinium sp. KB8]
PFDEYSDHRATCATSGILASRAVPIERAIARVCQVVCNGLPLWHAAQLAPSSYSWWDATGACRTVPQGEGCEQGDALAPALFALGQHKALCRPAAELHQNDALLGQCNEGRRDSLWHRLQLRQNKGVRAGTAPAAASWGKRCGEGTSHRLSEAWLSSAPQLIGHPDFVQAWAAESMQEERKLLQQLPELPDLQCSWLLFSMCPLDDAPHAGPIATLPAVLGGLGLQSAQRTAPAAYRAAWADALPVMRAHALDFERRFQEALEKGAGFEAPCLHEAVEARVREAGWQACRTWRALSAEDAGQGD